MVNDEISQHFPSSRASQVRPSFIRSRRLQATRLASRAHVFLAAEGFAVQITGETISWREKGSGIFSKWVITPVISGLTLLIPFITGVITYLLSGMSHQVPIWVYLLLRYVDCVIIDYTDYTWFIILWIVYPGLSMCKKLVAFDPSSKGRLITALSAYTWRQKTGKTNAI